MATLEDVLGPKWRLTIAGSAILIVAIAGLFYATGEFYRDEVISAEEAAKRLEAAANRGVKERITTRIAIDGTTLEGQQTKERINLTKEQGDLLSISASLSWQDEPAEGGPLFTNEPDSFRVDLKPPAGKGDLVEGEMSDTGFARASFEVPRETAPQDWSGEWLAIIVAGECGDHVGPLGLRTTPDPGNAWSLTVTIVYMGYPPSG